PDIQKLLVGGFAVNKLTGGLITNVFGGIAEAIAKSFIKAPLVNVSGAVVNVNGGVGGGLPGAAAGGGLLSTLGTVALPVTIAAVGTTAATQLANADLKSKGIKEQFQTPGSGFLPFGIEASLNNIATAIKIAQKPVPVSIKDAAKSDTRATLQVEKATARMQSILSDRLAQVHAKAQATAAAVKDADSTISGKVASTTAATRAGAASVAAAVRASRPIINVDVRVSATTISKTVNTTVRY